MSSYVNIKFSDCICSPEGQNPTIARKHEVIEYLRSGDLGAMCAGWMRDNFTGELVKGCFDHCRSDGTYEWGESLAYYVDKYDLQLPDEFLSHIYSRLG